MLFREAEVMISLSNLVKHCNVVTDTDAKRMIDSNSSVTQILKHLSRTNPDLVISGENAEGEFQEGIDVVKEIDLPTPEEILGEAQKNADEMLRRAKDQAAHILAEANSQVETMFEEQKQLGYQEGAERLNTEIGQMRAQLQEEYNSKLCMLEAEYSKRMDTMEKEIVEAIIQVFDKVFHIQFERKIEILHYLIRNTIEQNDADKAFRIRVSPANRIYFHEHPEVITDKLPDDITVEYIQDTSFEEGDCVIETDSGVFDCGLDTEYRNLINDIRSLC